eukprot:1142264-Pelagomonas_calceolata.AAC.1
MAHSTWLARHGSQRMGHCPVLCLAQATADPDVARTSKKGAASPATGRLRSKSEAQLNMFDSSGISLFSDSQCNNEHPSTTMLMPVVASDCEPSSELAAYYFSHPQI